MGKKTQKTITAIDIKIYPIINKVNFFFDWKPSRAATAPSNEPWGTPIKETKQSAIIERVVNSYILNKIMTEKNFEENLI